MIRFNTGPGDTIRIEQEARHPTVYLDHWAVMDISRDHRLFTRFVEAVARTEGTLVLSWLNVAEFSKITDFVQAKAAEDFVDSIIPNLFFIESNPFRVIANEDNIESSAPPYQPQADMEMLNVFAHLPNPSVRPFTASGLFAPIIAARGSEEFEAMATAVLNEIIKMRDQLDENPKEKKVVLGPPRGPCRRAGTLHMLRELSRRFFTDRTLEVTRNHAIDLIHAVVSVCYCDYVLLDAHWVDQVDTAASKFRAAKFSFPIAKVFSKKSDGLNRFFGALQGLES